VGTGARRIYLQKNKQKGLLVGMNRRWVRQRCELVRFHVFFQCLPAQGGRNAFQYLQKRFCDNGGNIVKKNVNYKLVYACFANGLQNWCLGSFA
jgi:hypothetical protein